ncbi:MAG: inositol monophosphatase family protein [Polyangia bacterium]
MRKVALAEIAPRFRKLGASDVVGKPSAEDPTDLVTVADRAAEAALTRELSALIPAASVVGEEATAADPKIVERINGDSPVWIVDPLDGTRNFAAGQEPFGTMVVLVERRILLAACIYFTEGDRLFLAERGQGAFLDGRRIFPRAREQGVLSGTLHTGFMPQEHAALLGARAAAHAVVPGATCAAHEYTQIALGLKDYTQYHRMLPWDHAPGALIVREAGGVVRHPDGRDYDVLDRYETTLLSVDEPTWRRARDELFG